MGVGKRGPVSAQSVSPLVVLLPSPAILLSALDLAVSFQPQKFLLPLLCCVFLLAKFDSLVSVSVSECVCVALCYVDCVVWVGW